MQTENSRISRWDQSAALYFAYAAAVDSSDEDFLRRLLTEDVIFSTVRRGVLSTDADGLLEIYRPLLVTAPAISRHLISNIRVLGEENGQIRTHAYFSATFHEEGMTRIQTGAYWDVHVERDGELLIAQKRIEVDPVVILPRDGTPSRV